MRKGISFRLKDMLKMRINYEMCVCFWQNYHRLFPIFSLHTANNKKKLSNLINREMK